MFYSVTASIISLVFGGLVSLFIQRKTEKFTRKEERFRNLYAPFQKMIWIQTHGAFEFFDLEPSLQRQFFELLFNNYEYADGELKELLLRFKWVYDTPSSKDGKDSNKCFFLIQQRIDTVFNSLCRSMFLEPYSIKHADKISKKWEKLP